MKQADDPSHLLRWAEQEALGGFKALGSSPKAPGVWVPLEAVLHPPDDGVHPLGRGLHRRLEVEGGEGDVLHGEVGLQRVGDVLVTCKHNSIGIKSSSNDKWRHSKDILWKSPCKLMLFLSSIIFLSLVLIWRALARSLAPLSPIPFPLISSTWRNSSNIKVLFEFLFLFVTLAWNPLKLSCRIRSKIKLQQERFMNTKDWKTFILYL